MRLISILISVSISFYSMLCYAEPYDFQKYLGEFKIKALSKNLPEKAIDATLKTVRFLPKVIQFDRRQNEFSISFEKYQSNQITTARIHKAQKYLKANRSAFDKIEKQFGVPREVIVALWAIESNFGRNMGSYHVPSSLATLAYEGRRREFFENQLMDAITIIHQGHISPLKMRGSWAGAMGQSQFMPSSFLSYAYDFTKDGTKDIWRAQSDVWASIANYLKTEGWQFNTPKAIPVILSPNMDPTLLDETYRPLYAYKKAGIQLLENLSGEYEAKIIVPKRTKKDQAFLVFRNFDVIMHWNKSHFFALTVAKLADKIRVN